MDWSGRALPLGALRCGRLIETPDGLVDLATGRAAVLASRWLERDEAAVWTAPAPGAAAGGADQVVLDGWLTQDWLGRWIERVVTIAEPEVAWLPAVSPLVWQEPAPGAMGVTRTDGATGWCRRAAAARSAGIVPVLAPWLAVLGAAPAAQWPPLLIGGTDASLSAMAVNAESWVKRGGRVSMLVATRALPERWITDAPSSSRASPAWAHRTNAPAAARQLRRALRAIERAPQCPSLAVIPLSAGGRDRMTHLELLDVSAQLEDARRDEDAMVVACRAVRAHTQAGHAAILVARSGEPRVLASDGPPGDSMLAWRQLCQSDAPEAVASARGWHAAGRHAVDHGASVYVCASWPSRDIGESRQSLLTVFARLVASRVDVPAPVVAPAPTGLEQTLVGDSVVMCDVRAQIALAARAPFPVLIRGESGCGKELAARAIHALGQRRHRRCAAINCAALPDELIESELFGHVKGAFTGAATDRAGLFDEADGGTLFLDEVGELGGRAQAKLLRVLQDGEVRRVGENQARRVDVRIIAATNVSLEDAVRRGTFRADLYYRLDVVRVRMPALRERRDDIPMLARHFWHECTARVGSRARLDARVLGALSQHDWPGNVRQLQNTLAALAVRVPSRGRVVVDDLPADIRGGPSPVGDDGRYGLDAARREFEASYVREALNRAGGRPSLAARELGMTRQGLSKLVRRLGLDEEEAGSRLP
jgi:DNA-binding NtrC family response regulator